jgi:hypothetical protein
MLSGLGLTVAGSVVGLVSESQQINVVTLLVAFGYGAVGYAAGAEDADRGDF